jgi:predicted nucleotidyltransferase
MLQSKLLDDLRKELKTNKDIEDIVVFGSAARTNFRRYNDIDVLFILRSSIERYKKTKFLEQVELKYNVKPTPLFNYISGLTPKPPLKTFNYFSGKSPLHIFYTDNIDFQKPEIGNIRDEKISVKYLDSDLVLA